MSTALDLHLLQGPFMSNSRKRGSVKRPLNIVIPIADTEKSTSGKRLDEFFCKFMLREWNIKVIKTLWFCKNDFVFKTFILSANKMWETLYIMVDIEIRIPLVRQWSKHRGKCFAFTKLGNDIYTKVCACISENWLKSMVILFDMRKLGEVFGYKVYRLMCEAVKIVNCVFIDYIQRNPMWSFLIMRVFVNYICWRKFRWIRNLIRRKASFEYIGALFRRPEYLIDGWWIHFEKALETL